MAGLVPAIHAYLCEMRREEDVDARDKRGHDDREAMVFHAIQLIKHTRGLKSRQRLSLRGLRRLSAEPCHASRAELRRL
jgi:hypothetical protein